MGDVLTVAVMKDNFVHKGKNRPMFSQDERVSVLRALAIVDEVITVENAIEALAMLKPSIWCVGIEYKNLIRPENAAYCRANRIEIVFTNRKTYSSTKICAYMRYEAGTLLHG